MEQAKAHVNDVVIRPEALMDKPVHELPTDYLMAEVSEIADIIAQVMDCSEDIVISTMFAVVAGAVGTKVQVYDGKYTNMLNVNVCHVAPPGSNKTQPVSLLVKPLENISLQSKCLGITVFQPRLKVRTFARTNYHEYGKQRQVQESP